MRPLLLPLVAALAAGCGGDDVTVHWTLSVDGAPATCEQAGVGFVAVVLREPAEMIQYDDLFDCAAGVGSLSPSDHTYEVTAIVFDPDAHMVSPFPTLTTLEVHGGGGETAIDLGLATGTVSWNITKAGVAATCAEVFADTVSLSTQAGGASFRFAFACGPGSATILRAPGGYTLTTRLELPTDPIIEERPVTFVPGGGSIGTSTLAVP